MVPKILLTGKPGVGKTTVVKKVIEGVEGGAGGFYTEEIRDRGRRKGFLIRTMEGECGVLAHIDHRGPSRVGRYGVDVDLFEKIAASSVEHALEKDAVIIIDEIGKMELFSKRFRCLVERVLESNKTVLAVVHQGRDPFTQKIRSWPHVHEWAVTEKNRDALPDLLLKKLNL
jgi:nucleoside-triphosphatase